jgi:hypothetical protein
MAMPVARLAAVVSSPRLFASVLAVCAAGDLPAFVHIYSGVSHVMTHAMIHVMTHAMIHVMTHAMISVMTHAMTTGCCA